jgi:hypothetical protein
VEQAGTPGEALLDQIERATAEQIMVEARTLVESLARDRPLVLVFEDIHWAEPTFLDLIEYLAARVHAPVLLLCLARPELLEDREGWGRGLANADSLVLEPLSPDESQTLAERLGSAGIDEESRSRLVATAEGNPLFVEQLLSALLLGEAGDLPPTIEALLAARLDRLGPAERAVVEVAAVMGRDFTVDGATELLPAEAARSVDRHIAGLVRREFLRPLRSASGEGTYSFRHALVREAAYRSTPKARRADLHRRCADRLERRASSQDELVGFHLEQAYGYQTELRPVDEDARRLAAAAGDRLALAGIRSWKRADVPAAVNLLQRSTNLLHDGERRRELLCELGLSLTAAGEVERGKDVLKRTLEGSVAAGDLRIEHRARIELLAMELFSDPTARAAELIAAAGDAIAVFEQTGDDRALGRAWLVGGRAEGALLCRNERWLEAAERARAHYERAGWPPSVAIGQAAAAMYHGPTPVEEALEACRKLAASESADGFARAGIIAIKALLRALGGGFDEARYLLDESVHRYRELGHRASVAADLGWVRGELELIAGDPQAAEEILGPLCRELADMGATEPLSTRAADLAEALYLQDRGGEALEWTQIAEANAAVDDLSAQFSWRGVRAKVFARANDDESAESLGREAVRIVEQTDALNQHAKLLLDLSEVLRMGGRPGEATKAARLALTRYEQKGNVIGAERARKALAERTPA